VLFRRLPLGFSIAYIPKGPVGQGWDALWPEVDAACRRRRAIFIKVEPDCWDFEPQANPDRVAPSGFQASQQAIQPPRTLVVSLLGKEADLMERMKQKTRYNIRLALKKGVVVGLFNDVELFYKLMQATGERDRFGVHNQAYFENVYDLFHPRGECEMLLAEFEGEPLAALMVFARGRRAWYFYGASADVHRERMPSYLLQWEAMRWARARGCSEYDLWGVPDSPEDVLEANFTARSDGLWGVYRFKRGFGGELRRSAGPWDRVFLPGIYRLYSMLVKRMGEREPGH
jgi:lipid II:glycine glycyltransferase (peptidoglycan interpeptide bridge formation enzyme)